MSYAPSTAADRAAMLRAIGLASVDELFGDIPAARGDPQLDLPAALPEADVLRHLQELAQRNLTSSATPSFLGAGYYRHFVPALVDQQLLRSEWYTAYTPYQAEMSQGTLQAIYEFQTLVCELTGMEVSNASLYDGASALAEAVLMCRGVTRRPGVVLADTVHPAYREVVRTYTQALDVELRTVRTWRRQGDSLSPDLDPLAAAIDDTTSCVVLQRPDFLGWVTDSSAVIDAARRHGAKLIYVVTDPVSLALLRPPGQLGADVVVGELRCLVGPPGYGGPGAGLFATRSELVRRVPGRISGRTKDLDGRQGFVLALQTREQHIRRERATSNITTNQALMALGASITLCALGRQGLRRMAEQSLSAAHRCGAALAEAGIEVATEAPFFHEFVVRAPADGRSAVERLLDHGVVAGYDLGQFDAELRDSVLVCATELTTTSELEALIRAWGEVFGG
jgi:glycine dehydrogenase subunit 1